MIATSYDELSDSDLMALCVWREADDQQTLGKRGVAHVIQNRMKYPSEFGHSIRSIILKPYAFSSFNEGNPDSTKYPNEQNAEEWQSWLDSQTACQDVLQGTDTDFTGGCVMYHDTSIGEPPAWTKEFEFVLQVGRLKFYRKV
jgi:N-acetylmuramoyl-L-alanine amidase